MHLQVGAIVTLMSADAERLPMAMLLVHSAWILPIFILSALIMMWNLIGLATLVAIGIIVLTVPVQGKMAALQQVNPHALKIVLS